MNQFLETTKMIKEALNAVRAYFNTVYWFEIKKKVKKSNKIITYCTGGVKCEKASAFLKENGYETSLYKNEDLHALNTERFVNYEGRRREETQ